MPVRKKKNAIPESVIEDELSRQCEIHGIYQHKNTGRNGIPDRLLIHEGRHWFVELKRPGEKPTELQRAVARELKCHGAVTLWADSVESVQEIIARLWSGDDPPSSRIYGRPKNLEKL